MKMFVLFVFSSHELAWSDLDFIALEGRELLHSVELSCLFSCACKPLNAIINCLGKAIRQKAVLPLFVDCMFSFLPFQFCVLFPARSGAGSCRGELAGKWGWGKSSFPAESYFAGRRYNMCLFPKMNWRF